MKDALLFLSPKDAETVEAMAARIVPGDSDDPGAREAGVVYYIDRTLAGFHRDLQDLYKRGLWELDEYCSEMHGATFVALDENAQDKVLSDISLVPSHPQYAEVEERIHGRGWTMLSAFFSVVRQQTVEGMFCDPAYGGNRDGVGWKLIGFPGAQWGYSDEQMKLGFDARTIPIKTLHDLQEEYGPHRDRR